MVAGETHRDDRLLLDAIRGGSVPAFNALMDRHQQAVRTFLRGMTSSHPEADDLAQETFLAAWTHAKSFRGQGSVRAWLFSIAWRKAKGSQRRWFRWMRRDKAYHDATTLAEAMDSPTDAQILARQALALLPLEQRAAIVLCLAHGHTHAEVSEMLGLPLGTVKSHVLRGQKKLREILEVES